MNPTWPYTVLGVRVYGLGFRGLGFKVEGLTQGQRIRGLKISTSHIIRGHRFL